MNTKRGLIGTIILIAAALILLGYYNISFEKVAQSPLVKENLLYAWELIISAAKSLFEWVLAQTKDFSIPL